MHWVTNSNTHTHKHTLSHTVVMWRNKNFYSDCIQNSNGSVTVINTSYHINQPNRSIWNDNNFWMLLFIYVFFSMKQKPSRKQQQQPCEKMESYENRFVEKLSTNFTERTGLIRNLDLIWFFWFDIHKNVWKEEETDDWWNCFNEIYIQNFACFCCWCCSLFSRSYLSVSGSCSGFFCHLWMCIHVFLFSYSSINRIPLVYVLCLKCGFNTNFFLCVCVFVAYWNWFLIIF